MNCWSLRNLLFCLYLIAFIGPLALAQAATSKSDVETSDLAVGKVRQELAAQRAVIAEHPNDPSGYVHLAYTLTDAGINDEARKEVLRATVIAPTSAFAYSAQAWVLHHNAIGVDYGRGFDYDASLASYRKAVDLYPGDLDLRQSLANLLEYNRNGIRYAPDAHLAEAIENYRYSKAHLPVVNETNEDNLLICLFYAGRFQEVLSELASLQSSPARNGFWIAATAATRGSTSAITVAKHIDGDEQNRRDALHLAAEGLWNMRLYSQASDLLTASLPDTSDLKSLVGKIQIFSNLRPYKGVDLPSTDPRSPVQRLMIGAITDTLSDALLGECMSHHPFPSDLDWKRNMPQAKRIAGMFRNLSRQTGLPQVVVQDIVLGSMKINTVPSKEAGSRIVVEFAGLPPQNFFVINEDGAYRIVALNESVNEVGVEALFLLHHDQEAEATSLLDWKRELITRGDGDDPLGGPLFARIWISGQSKGSKAIELAAASLISSESIVVALRPQVLVARNDAKTDRERDDLDLLLTVINLCGEDSVAARLTSQRLLARQPDSITAVMLAGRAYGLTKDWVSWKALLATHLQDHPNDRGLLLQEAAEAEAEGDFSRARRAFRTILDGGHALADDYNMYAWLSLFVGTVDDQAFAAAQQANLLTRNSNYAYLHTLACVSAAQGKTAQARQLLLEAMISGYMDEPNGAIWYGFGRIYEQYGVYDAARAAYNRVERPEGVLSPTDPFVLAQSSIKSLPTH
jgi:tetratricopeptide (TPR) repeat protein